MSSIKEPVEILAQLRNEITKLDEGLRAAQVSKRTQADLQAEKNTLQKQNQELTTQLDLLKDEVSKAEVQIRLLKDIFSGSTTVTPEAQ